MTHDGERHHIIDPRQGRSTTGVRWVSVIGARATQAEVLTKVVFVAGAETGGRIVEDNACYAVVIDDRARVTELGCLEGTLA
jgi:thiamine biosynthesis lipoprotein ApbE